MHAGEAKNGSDQRAHEDKFLAASGETTMPAEIQNEKCTPAIKNGSDQRTHGGKFPAGSGETTMPAGKRDEKCTPARQRTVAASGHTAANSPPPASK